MSFFFVKIEGFFLRKDSNRAEVSKPEKMKERKASIFRANQDLTVPDGDQLPASDAYNVRGGIREAILFL